MSTAPAGGDHDEDHDGDVALAAVSAELDNLRIAWARAAARRDLGQLEVLREPLWHLYESRGWYQRAVEVLEDHLAVIVATPDRADRWQQELALRSSLARALTLLRGYTSEVEDAYAEAVALFEAQREVPQLFPVLRSLASFHGFRGEFDKGMTYAREILRLAESQKDDSMRVDGYALLGAYTGFTGQLSAGLGFLDDATRAFETRGYRPRRLRLGIDARVSTLTTAGFFLWLLGLPDQAAARAERAITIAADLEHPYSHAFALFHSGFIRLWRREPELVRERAIRTVAVAEAGDQPVWLALGTCLLGAATSALGRPDEGLRQIADGVDQYRGLRTPPVFWPMIRFMQAAAHVDGQAPGPAFAYIDEALAVGGPDEVISPLFHVVRGDLSVLAGDRASAIRSYERGLATGQRFDAPLPQLRAAVRLWRIASDDERSSRAAVIRPLLASFTEGWDTADLREAAEIVG